MPDLVTVERVPILRTGTYELSTGTRTFAEEDLRAAAEALATDPGVKAPRIKIDSLAQALGLDPATHGGEPAFGWFDDLTVSENGQELLATAHVPEWIAEGMAWAYPSLSIEGTPVGWESSTGRTHELVITAVALLGVHWPGVTTLDDFREVMATGEGVAFDPEPSEVVLARMPLHERPLRASLDSDLVVRRFYDWLDDPENRDDLPEGVDAYNLWVRSMRFDNDGRPYLKVTDEGSGTLYRVDFAVNGSDPTFDGFTEVVEQDVPVAAGAPIPTTQVSWASREAARAVRATATEEGHVPLDLDALRTRLGLAADADEDAINAALAETPPSPGPTPVPGGDPPEGDPVPPEGDPERQPVTATSDLTVTVSREQWEEQQSRLTRLETTDAERAKAEQTAERDALVAAAMHDGRIAPAERDRWRSALDEAPKATSTLIGALTPNKVPITARGADLAEGAHSVETEGTGLFPELDRQEA